MIGKTLAQYEITAPLGKGGMGEVYRARDTKLGREVAIKVLPKEMSGDPERAARFDREARALASLQHANVASIYGFEHAEGTQFLVMELVEGQNLQERLMEGALAEEDLLRVARQMAAGLEAAHDKGIVHRDLKPANVMFTPDGEVKILDFGLARAWFGDNVDDGDMTASPTITAAMTQAGTILGTAAYMSPEQARGKNVDRRADIWAFGVILWEMLTGKRLFDGETVSDTLAAVIRAEPEWDLLPSEEHPLLCRLIERCLIRDPRQRLRDIGEARIVLEDPNASVTQLSMLGAPAAPAAVEAASKPPLIPMLIIALLFSALGAGVGWKLLASEAESPLLHLMMPPPPELHFNLSGGAPGPSTLSPDGTMITFTAMDEEGTTRLYLRHLDQADAVLLSGSEGAAYPFWSPDSGSIGFFTPSGDDKLKKVSVTGSAPITLCPATNGKGGSWNEDGVIVFAPSHDTPLHRVPAIGGDPEPITEIQLGEDSHRHPRFLPGGRQFLFLARLSGTPDMQSIQIGSLDGDSVRTVTQSMCQAEYNNGNLLTARDGVLLATPFDPKTGTLTGGATPLVENILIATAGSAAGAYSVSSSGMLSYQTGVSKADRILEWVELDSEAVTSVPTTGQLWYPRLSPDGSQCLVEVYGESSEGADLWLVDMQTGLRTRFTFEMGDEVAGCWTPDGESVVYTSRTPERHQVLIRPVGGVSGATVVYESESTLRSDAVTPDGLSVVISRESEDWDIQLLSLTPGSEPEDLITTDQDEAGGRVSPDGRWIAYHQTSSSTWDIFVSPVAGGSRQWQVSTNGAVWPQWSADGTQLFTSAFDGRVLAYQVDIRGESFAAGGYRVAGESEDPGSGGTAFSVHPDGRQILRTATDPSVRSDISLVHIVTDWRRALAR